MAQNNIGKVAATGIAELAKRVPPNQVLQFKNFQAKYTEYLQRVSQFPEKLPKIDWDFYRLNVRPEFSAWVDDFQKKYKAFCEKFDARDEQDYSKHFVELEKVRAEVQAEYEKFKEESNERIKALEAEYDRIKALKPYEEMTAEEYCELLPDKSMYMHKGNPSFWPHTLEEQSLKRPVIGRGRDGDEDGGGNKKPPKGDGGPSGSAPPSAASSGAKDDVKTTLPSTSSVGDSQAKDSSSSKELRQKLPEEIEKQIKLARIFSPLIERQEKELQEIALKK